MLTEQAQVVAIEGDRVRVATARQSACDSCRSQAGCGQKLLAGIGRGQRFEIVVENPQRLILQPGDQVELGIEEASFLQASVMVYLVPLLMMVMVAFAAEFVAVPEIGVIGLAVVGLAAGFVVVKRWSGSRAGQCRYQPRILTRVAS